MKAVYSYRMTSSSAYIQGRPDLNRSLCVSNKHGFSLETYERLRFRNLSTASSSNSSSSSPLSRDDEINDKADSEERKANFWNVFLTDAIEISSCGKFKVAVACALRSGASLQGETVKRGQGEAKACHD